MLIKGLAFLVSDGNACETLTLYQVHCWEVFGFRKAFCFLHDLCCWLVFCDGFVRTMLVEQIRGFGQGFLS